MNNALIDCKIEERLESMKFISLLTVFSNGKKRKRKIEKMRFYRGNEYGYEISQKNDSRYYRVTCLHVVSPVLENDNEGAFNS